jgi:hypothetical protein
MRTYSRTNEGGDIEPLDCVILFASGTELSTPLWEWPVYLFSQGINFALSGGNLMQDKTESPQNLPLFASGSITTLSLRPLKIKYYL